MTWESPKRGETHQIHFHLSKTRRRASDTKKYTFRTTGPQQIDFSVALVLLGASVNLYGFLIASILFRKGKFWRMPRAVCMFENARLSLHLMNTMFLNDFVPPTSKTSSVFEMLVSSWGGYLEPKKATLYTAIKAHVCSPTRSPTWPKHGPTKIPKCTKTRAATSDE